MHTERLQSRKRHSAFSSVYHHDMFYFQKLQQQGYGLKVTHLFSFQYKNQLILTETRVFFIPLFIKIPLHSKLYASLKSFFYTLFCQNQFYKNHEAQSAYKLRISYESPRLDSETSNAKLKRIFSRRGGNSFQMYSNI